MEERKILNKDDILRVDDSSFVEIFVKEWDGHVRLYVISAKDRLEFEGKYTGESGVIDFKHNDAPLDLLASSLRTDSGSPMFTRDEISILGNKNGRVVHELFQKSLEINWMTRKTEEEVKKK